MLIQIFTLKFDSVLDRFDDGKLQNFVKDKEILSIRDHFFTRDEIPYLTVVVTYNPLRPEVEEKTGADRNRKSEDRDKWREILEEADWPLFNSLRDWRNNLAREEGMPPYVICTNKQLAQIAHRRPESLNKLSAIEGMGKAKLDRYGAAILSVVEPVAAEQAGGSEEDVESDDG
jgi:ATP-dependent DNA helicase RecQ